MRIVQEANEFSCDEKLLEHSESDRLMPYDLCQPLLLKGVT
eukprot:COSAG02_NODE_926_length_15856_cov_13.975566_20_plen_41_part_00